MTFPNPRQPLLLNRKLYTITYFYNLCCVMTGSYDKIIDVKMYDEVYKSSK